MGVNDAYYTKFYGTYVADVVDRHKIKKIAWLGWTSSNAFVEDIERICPNLEKSNFFDIVTDNPQTIKWDINKQWDISGYDLVICLRTTMFVTDKDHFLSELSKATKTNGCVIMDFWLPEIKRFSDFHRNQREFLREVLGHSDKIEYFFDWPRPVWNMTQTLEEYMSSNQWSPAGSKKDIKNGLMQGQGKLRSRISFIKFGDFGGYELIPKFDTVYKHMFKNEVGFDYNPEVVGYPSYEKTLTELDLYRHRLKMSNASLAYTLNVIPPEVWLSLEETGGEYVPIHGQEFTDPDGRKHVVAKPNFDKKIIIIGTFKVAEG